MTDEIVTSAERGGVPAWYWVAAVCALLFEALGCFFYLAEVRMSAADLAALPLDQRAMLAARPAWYYAAFAVAVWVGLIGTLGLLLRKRWAVPALLVSLIAVIVQFSAIFIVPDMRTMSSDALVGPVIVTLICYGIFNLSQLAKRRRWLS